MPLPFVSRRRYEQDITAVKKDRDRLRGERQQFAADRDAQRDIAQRVAAELKRAYRVNACLTEELEALKARLADRPAVDGTDWQALYEQEKKRTAGLQKRYDDATSLDDPRLAAGARWQDTRTDRPRKAKP